MQKNTDITMNTRNTDITMNTRNNLNTKPADRNDMRLLRLRRELGLEGYAVYSMLRECVCNAGGAVAADYELLAFDFRAAEDMVRRVAEGYALFLVADGLVMELPDGGAAAPVADGEPDGGAPGEGRRAVSAELRRKRSEAGRKGMRSRWNNRRGITNDNKTITTGGEKKEKENLPPTPPIKEKDKEKAEEEKKDNSALGDNKAVPADVRNVPAGDEGDYAEHADSKSSAADADGFCRRFSSFWNDCIRRADSRLRPISILSASRRRQLERLRRGYDSRQISVFVWRACNSPYLNARNGRLRQPADIDWMLASDERIVKIIEGNL